MKTTVEIELVTPKIAEMWLANQLLQQRKLRDRYVSRLAEEIACGRWRLSCDAIVLVKGLLGNGQHRLNAVVASKKACQFLVMRTDDDELFKVIDCGASRTVADVLGGSYIRESAAAVKYVLCFKKGTISPNGNGPATHKTKLSTTPRGEIIEYVLENQKELASYAAFARSLYGQQPLLSVAQAVALQHLVFLKYKSVEKCQQFLSSVYLGKSDDSASDLRDRLTKNVATVHKLPMNYIFALLIKAYRSYHNGTRPGVLKMADGETFPSL